VRVGPETDSEEEVCQTPEEEEDCEGNIATNYSEAMGLKLVGVETIKEKHQQEEACHNKPNDKVETESVSLSRRIGLEGVDTKDE
jgi:hypothetical protein